MRKLGNRRWTRSRSIFPAVALGCAVLAGPSAKAASAAWTGATDSTWAGANWSASPVPGSADTATFNASSTAVNSRTTPDLGTGVTVGSLVFDSATAGAYTIGAGSVGSQTLKTTKINTAPAIVVNGSVTHNELINANIQVDTSGTNNGSLVWNNSTTSTLTLAGTVSAAAGGIKTLMLGGSGAGIIGGAVQNGSASTLRITKSGSGSWILRGNNTVNTVNGFVDLYNGLLEFDCSNAGTGTNTNFGLPSGMPINFGDGGAGAGATIEFLGKPGANVTNQTLGNVASQNNTGMNTFLVAQNSGLGVNMTLGGISTNNNSIIFFDAATNSSGSITTTSTNTNGLLNGNGLVLVRDSTGRIDFATNSTNASGGSLVATNASTALPAATGSSSTNYALSGSQTLTAGTAAASLRITTTALGQSLALGSSNLSVFGSGLLFAGANDYSISSTTGSIGSTTAANAGIVLHDFGAGKLTVSALLGRGNGGINFFGNGGLIDWNGASNTTATNATTSLYEVSGVTVRQSFSGTNAFNLTNLDSGVASGWHTGTGNMLLNNGGIFEMSAGNLTRDLGTGTGQLQLNGNGGFSAYSANRSVRLASGATLAWGSTASFLPDGAALLLGSSYSNATLDFQNPINLNGGNRVVQVNNGTSTTDIDGYLSGVISDSVGGGMLTKTGAGTLCVSGANTYTGVLAVSAGSVKMGASSSLSAANTVSVDSLNSSTFDINNLDSTIGGLNNGTNGGGSVTNSGAAAHMLTLGGSGTYSFSGIITATTAANLALTKTGAGTQTLSGLNTYGGATTLNGGVLSVTKLAVGGSASGIGKSSNAAGNLVFNGGTLQYTGSGDTTDRAITLAAGGGTLYASGTGSVTFSNTASVSFSGSGTHLLTLTGTNTGSNTLAAAISDLGGATSVVKNGTGTWILTNALTDISGIVTVNTGTLNFSGAATIGALVANTGSHIVLNQAVFSNSFTVASTALASGNYTSAYLNTTYPTIFSGTGGSITVLPASPTLLSDFRFDEASGNPANAAGAPDGTLQSDRTDLALPVYGGGGIQFTRDSGGLGNWVNATTSGFPNSISWSAGTVSFWIKSNYTAASETILGTANAGTAEYFKIDANEDGSGNYSANSVQLYIRGNSGHFFGYSGSIATALDNTWHHLTFTWNVDSTASLYIDGTAQTLTRRTGSTLTSSDLFNDWTYPLGIGCFSTNVRGNYFTGSLSDVAVWDQPLLPVQVEALRNLTSSVLAYGSDDAAKIFSTFADGTGSHDTTSDGQVWAYTSGLTGSPGTLVNSNTALVLDASGNGVAIVPASTTQTSYADVGTLKSWYTSYAGSQWYERFQKSGTNPSPRQLDLTNWVVTFQDNFTSLSDITAATGAGPWFAPGHADFDSSTLVTPGDSHYNNVFSISGGLQMKSYRTAVGQPWYSGCIATGSYPSGSSGMYQKYGYFEAQITMPQDTTTTQKYTSHAGLWLESKNRYIDASGNPDSHSNYDELDAVEMYAGDFNGHHATSHVHFRTDSGQNGQDIPTANYYNLASLVPSGILNSGSHRYGIKVGPYYVIAYFDHNEVARYQTVYEDTQPQFMLISNTAYATTGTVDTNLTWTMTVQGVTMYALPTEIIVDNSDATGVTTAGTWSLFTGDSKEHGASFLDDGGTGKGSDSVTYTPNLPCDGKYDVYAWWPAGANQANNVPVTVTYNDPTDYTDQTNLTASATLDQTAHAGQWNLVGSYNFREGTNGSVKISNTATSAGTHVTADAVRFVLQQNTLLPIPRPVGTH